MKGIYPKDTYVSNITDIDDKIIEASKHENLPIKDLTKKYFDIYMKDIGLDKTGLNQLIKVGYVLLILDSFFTSGPEESRAWTVKKNTLAPKAASVIDTDFE